MASQQLPNSNTRLKVMQCLNQPCAVRIFKHADTGAWIEYDTNNIHKCPYARKKDDFQPQQKKTSSITICKFGCDHKLTWDGTLRKFRETEGPFALEIHDCREWPVDEATGKRYDPRVNMDAIRQDQTPPPLMTYPPQYRDGQEPPTTQPQQSEHFQLEMISVLNKINENLELNNQYIRGLNQNLVNILDYDKSIEYNTAEILETLASADSPIVDHNEEKEEEGAGI